MEIRTSKPAAGNKYYITKANGGLNGAIKGNPTDICDVLANCVGFANGRFAEIMGEFKYQFICNAENFIERAKAYGLQVVNYPTLGGIMVFQKGDTLSGNDGAGHVFIVEKILDANTIYTSESGYNSKAFWNSTRSNNNGRWGMSSAYKFRGCIVNPAIGDVHYVEPPKPIPASTPSDKFNIGDEVILSGPIYVSSNDTKVANTISNKKTKITRKNPGSAHPYNTTGDLGWCDEKSLTKVENNQTTNVRNLKVGDQVLITGTGNASSNGDGPKAYGLGWVRVIQKIYPGRKFPYQVGNSKGTTGFYTESSLQKNL